MSPSSFRSGFIFTFAEKSYMNTLKFIDLSHVLSSDISVYPGSDHPDIRPVAFLNKEGYREHLLVLNTHHGTHVDCPAHLLSEGFHTGNAPLSHFFGKGTVVDCRQFRANENIPAAYLRSHEASIARSDFLLFCTGMDKHWNTPGYEAAFAVPDRGAAEYLAGFPLKGIGIDALSVDPVHDTALVNHRIFLSRHIIIVENLTGLEQLTEREFWFSCLPLKLAEGDGSPVRACAILEGLKI